MDHDFIHQLASSYGTPFYLMYPMCFKNNVRCFKAAFTKRYEKFILAYSFKTNYTIDLLRVALDEGCYAEVVSDLEYDLALRLGFSAEHIIFNGPVKKYKYLLKAIRNHSIVNVDALYEIDYLLAIRKSHPDWDISVGLRINMEINTADGGSAVQGGLAHSRFGMTEGDLSIAIPQLRAANIRIVSIHGHTSSDNRVVENYQIIAHTMLAVCKRYKLDDIRCFDLGGGYFGAAPEGLDLAGRPTYQDYADGILAVLLSDEWFFRVRPFIVIEPGTSVIANVFDIVTQIYQQKNICGKNYVVVDAGIMNVKTIMSTKNYLFDLISDKNEQAAICADVVGSTCMERDIILRDVLLDHYRLGDYIRFRGVGAYVLSMTPVFINYLFPIIAIYNDKKYQLIRRKQTLDDILTIYECNENIIS